MSTENETKQQTASGPAVGSRDGLGHSGYMRPVISLCADEKRIGLFNEFDLVREFQSYENEADALKEANEWFKSRTIHVPQVVRPIIKRIRVS